LLHAPASFDGGVTELFRRACPVVARAVTGLDEDPPALLGVPGWAF
jgi:hypothetical protein